MIFQCSLHLILLAVSANEVTKAFSKEQKQEWCGPNGVLMTSVGFFLIYNLLAILAMEDHTIVCLKRELSPKMAMSATLMAGIFSCGILFGANVLSTAELCASHIASTTACSLMMIVLLLLAWRICTHADHHTTKTSTETSLLLNFMSKNKATALLTVLIVVCIVLTILEVLSSVVTRFHESNVKFNETKFYKNIFYLNVIWFSVGIALPFIFQQLIDSSADVEETTDENHSSDKIAYLVLA